MIDAHHHIWLQKDLPWLLGPEQPRIFGSYGPIKRDYPMAEYLADLKGTGIKKSVYVQANWAPNWAHDEVAWVQSMADDHGVIAGIVGYADFTVDDVRPQLDRLKDYPLMRGIRQQLHWHENPAYRFAPHAEVARDPKVQANIARLAEYGWSFDLQVFAGQMEGAAELAAICPDVTFILQHAGMLEDISKEGWAAWRKGMKLLAKAPNVVTKLSAFGTFSHKNDPAFIAKIITETLKIFDAERCMYGSNFPIEKIWTSYAALWKAFQKATADLSTAQQQAIFHDTAARIYRLQDA
ncbi:MAG: amidohydrolase family protein [Pseudomonadota bacterium]